MFYTVVILTFVFFASNLPAHTGTGSENTSCLCISYKMKLSFSVDMEDYLKLNIFCCYCLFPKNYAANESSKVLCFVQVFHCNFIFSGFFCIQANLTLCLVFWHDNNCALHWRVVLFLQVWLHRSSPSI